MKILFTGASSFTGYWFVKSLAQAGHQVVCPLASGPEAYCGVRKERIARLRNQCQLVPDAPFGTNAFGALISASGPWDLLCHHGAFVTDYKSPDFDALRAVTESARGLKSVLAALKHHGLKGAVLTGSVFENDEGVGEEPLRAFSPYGLSKGLTWQVFRYYCVEAKVPLGKFVIANPFGPFEEPRFTAYLMRTWKDGKLAGVKTPDYVRDNIHVDLLASLYVEFAIRVASLETGMARLNPSGYIESQGKFAQRVAREVSSRTGWKCELDLARQQDFAEPMHRVNTVPAAPYAPDWSESKAWDDFVEFYTQQK